MRRDGDNNPALKQLRDTFKLKRDSFYWKMIKDLAKHERTTFTTNEDLVDQSFRYPFFKDLEENHGVFKIQSANKGRVNITKSYQCFVTIYQLAKLCMLEFYYDYLDKYLDRRDFELIQMDIDSLYIAISSTSINEIVKPELTKEYDHGGKATFLSTLKYDDRTLGLFKAEFQGTRMIAVTSKCYYAEDAKSESKFSCKGISKKQNPMSWERYLEALNGSFDVATDTGLWIQHHRIVIYAQNKLGLSIHYDKRIIAPNEIHMKPLR